MKGKEHLSIPRHVLSTGMPSLLSQIFTRFSHESWESIDLSRKRSWNSFLETGEMPLPPSRLKSIIEEILNVDGNTPRGSKLMERRRTTSFTLREDGTAHRPEEGLERLILISNQPGMYNQIPVGGGKESADLLYTDQEENGTFIELKPWATNASPLYALIESLKNLTLYRLIAAHGLNSGPLLKSASIAVLAPEEYYTSFGLPISEAPRTKLTNLKMMFEEVFETDINFLVFNYPRAVSDTDCNKLRVIKRKASLEDATPILSLRKCNWREIT